MTTLKDLTPPLRSYIDGTWQAHAPNNPRPIEAALHSGVGLHQSRYWDEAPLARAEALEGIAAFLADPARLEAIALADSLTTSVVINSSRRMTHLLPHVFSAAAHIVRAQMLGARRASGPHYFRRAWGPALLIAPWNSPTLIGAHKLASAMAAGAPAILKPSIFTPHGAMAMFEAIDHVGVPKGAAQLLLCDRQAIGPMFADPRIAAISFTGGLAGGRMIAQASAPCLKPLQLELGGNNPLIVLDCADLDLAAQGIVFGLCNLNGQWCRGVGRVIIAASIKDKLLDRVMEKLAALRMGEALDETSQMGPQAHARQFQDVKAALDKLLAAGGRALHATTLPTTPPKSATASGSYFFPPTLVDGCTLADTQDEIFGPVASLHTFHTQDQALEIANASPFGLAAYIFGQESRALALAGGLRVGSVKINGISLTSLNPDFPRAAWGLSGLGEEGIGQSVRFFTGARVVGVAPQEALGQ